MATLVQALFIVLLAIAGGVATHFLHPRAPAWYVGSGPQTEDEITLAQVQERWEGKVLWIDARSRQAYEKSHLPGALLLNDQEADQLMFEHFEKLQDNTLPIVVYCDGAECHASRKIRQYLKERISVDEIYVLRGGWGG